MHRTTNSHERRIVDNAYRSLLQGYRQELRMGSDAYWQRQGQIYHKQSTGHGGLRIGGVGRE